MMPKDLKNRLPVYLMSSGVANIFLTAVAEALAILTADGVVVLQFLLVDIMD